MNKMDCDCKPKPETRDGHLAGEKEESFFKGMKKDKNHEPITADQLKEKVQGKIAERATSVSSCNEALDTIPGQISNNYKND